MEMLHAMGGAWKRGTHVLCHYDIMMVVDGPSFNGGKMEVKSFIEAGMSTRSDLEISVVNFG